MASEQGVSKETVQQKYIKSRFLKYVLICGEKMGLSLEDILEQGKRRYQRDNYDNYNDYDDHDYSRDTWDAMTDGMYGDMPDGFDGDYSFLGY